MHGSGFSLARVRPDARLTRCVWKMVRRHEVAVNHYADLNRLFPTSACDTISVWRSGTMVGVPAVLLVEGDVIALKPGDRSPATIRLTEGELGAAPGSRGVTLNAGEAFLPEMVDNADYDNVHAQVSCSLTSVPTH
jgi:hypothetical protein